MATESVIDVVPGDGIQTWVMQAAPVNAIGPEFLAALGAALDRALADESVSAVVLASGLRVFSAGADASWMAGVVSERGSAALLEEFNATMDSFRDACTRLRRAPLLVVGALAGHTLAGGLELAAACDLRFVADNERIKIGAPEMELFGAMPTGGGGVQFLARLMGPARALKFILDATPVPPREALRLGIVEAVLPPEDFLASVQAFATTAATRAGRVGLAASKRSILGGSELPLYEALEFDRSLHWDAMRRGNFLAGVDAFVAEFGGGSR
jgi:enoyl-CoA hydratase